jgi:hypothetical protein
MNLIILVKIMENFIKKHYRIEEKQTEYSFNFTDNICSNSNMSENFIRYCIKNQKCDMSMWTCICRNTSISENLLKENISKIKMFGMHELCLNQSISESFFKTIKNKLNWNYLCENESISESFFEENLDFIVWKSLLKNKNISEEFFQRHLEKLKKLENNSISDIGNLTLDFFIENKILKKIHLLLGITCGDIFNIHNITIRNIKRNSYLSFDNEWKTF